MRSLKELLPILNKCIMHDTATDKLKLNEAKFETRVPCKRERTGIIRAIENEPPDIIPYKDQFCQIDYVPFRKSMLAVIVDASGKAVLIVEAGKRALWEEHDA